MNRQKREKGGGKIRRQEHDFNNVLGLILGYTTLLLRHPSDTVEVKRNAEGILKAISLGEALTKSSL
jgi:uncharacterized membrane protein YjjP (DUF1212 family)